MFILFCKWAIIAKLKAKSGKRFKMFGKTWNIFVKNRINKVFSGAVSTLTRLSGRTIRSYAIAASKTKNSEFPEKLINKKIKNPCHFYIAHNDGATIIFEEIAKHLKKLKKNPKVFYEINPGTLSLTKLLLDEKDMFQKLVLIEHHEEFVAKAEVPCFLSQHKWWL